MYDKIIVSLALDHGIADRALATARHLCAPGGQIMAVHVYEPLQGSVNSYVSEDAVVLAQDTARQALAQRIGDSTDVQPVLLKGHSGRAITDYAAEIGADLIIVGSHKPGLMDFFLGSTAARVVRHAPCSVHVLR